MAKLRIVLADDHGVLRAGLKVLLADQPDLEVVGEAETREDAVQLARDLRPDMAILDVRMPGDGLAATRQMKQELPELKVLILSQYDDAAYLRRALAAGASGYALKRASGQELLEAIRLVALGYTTQQIADQLFLSVRTVETYKVRTMEKLGLSGRAALVRYALEHGLLEAEPDR